jgi:hypothetical protein
MRSACRSHHLTSLVLLYTRKRVPVPGTDRSLAYAVSLTGIEHSSRNVGLLWRFTSIPRGMSGSPHHCPWAERFQGQFGCRHHRSQRCRCATRERHGDHGGHRYVVEPPGLPARRTLSVPI